MINFPSNLPSCYVIKDVGSGMNFFSSFSVESSSFANNKPDDMKKINKRAALVIILLAINIVPH